MSGFVGGWREDLEKRAELVATASPMPDFSGVFMSAPPVDEPWALVKQENQGSQGSCQGHDLSTIAEVCYRIATGGESIQLSRQYAYIETQRIDGLIGSDRGSTITGGVKLATTKGICEETLWPYTGKYHTKPTGATLEQCYENAKKYRIAQHSMMQSYDDVFNWIDRGTGGVSFGIGWNSSCDRAVCESYSRGGGGGHAIPVLFKSPRKDSQGRHYLWMNNSWGANWGNKGWSEWSPDFISGVLRDNYTVAVGLTDMVDVKPRPIDYTGRLA